MRMLKPFLLPETVFYAPICAALLLGPAWLIGAVQVAGWLLCVLLLGALALYGRQAKARLARDVLQRWLDGDDDAIRAPSLWLWAWGWVGPISTALALSAAGLPWLATVWMVTVLYVSQLNREVNAEVRRMDLDVQRALQAYRDATDHPV